MSEMQVGMMEIKADINQLRTTLSSTDESFHKHAKAQAEFFAASLAKIEAGNTASQQVVDNLAVVNSVLSDFSKWRVCAGISLGITGVVAARLTMGQTAARLSFVVGMSSHLLSARSQANGVTATSWLIYTELPSLSSASSPFRSLATTQSAPTPAPTHVRRAASAFSVADWRFFTGFAMYVAVSLVVSLLVFACLYYSVSRRYGQAGADVVAMERELERELEGGHELAILREREREVMRALEGLPAVIPELEI